MVLNGKMFEQLQERDQVLEMLSVITVSHFLEARIHYDNHLNKAIHEYDVKFH